MTTEREPPISIMAACKIVGVSRRTIYNWINARKVDYVRTAGGSIRIYADSLYRPGSTPTPDGGHDTFRAAFATKPGSDA